MLAQGSRLCMALSRTQLCGSVHRGNVQLLASPFQAEDARVLLLAMNEAVGVEICDIADRR